MSHYVSILCQQAVRPLLAEGASGGRGERILVSLYGWLRRSEKVAGRANKMLYCKWRVCPLSVAKFVAILGPCQMGF